MAKTKPAANAQITGSSDTPAPPRTEVKITAAKGRPMLTWVGKRPLSHVTAFPAQHVETYSAPGNGGSAALDPPYVGYWPRAYPKGGLLFHGDNKEVLAHLLANGFRGKVNLVYIDPPFDSGADYVRKVSLRGARGTAKIDGESYTLGEQIQYTDIWANDNYLQFMYERLLLLKELLAEDGSFYLHCDWNKSHFLRCISEEVFGAGAVLNEIAWQRTSARSDSETYNHIHDVLLFISKGSGFIWNQQYEAHSVGYLEDKYSNEDENGRRYMLDNITSPNPRPNMTYAWMGFQPPEKGWRYSRETMQRLHDEGRIWYPSDKSKRPRLKRYLDEMPGRPLQSIWTDIYPVNSQAAERLGYPTQKPEPLLERIIRTSSNPGDLVLDCFAGSGTTAAVAQRLGRRWIGCDINKGAIQTTAKRLQSIMAEQAAKKPAAPRLPGMEDEGEAEPAPAKLSFGVWRVNDYDLQIQHNEAVALACEHVGVQRSRADAFFDGTRGTSLVKVIPFGHPLTPLDLEELKRELEARPDEDRPVTLVCLGMELAAQAWVDDWNRLRKGRNAVNRIEVFELRTDPRYGRFLRHEPASGRVSVTRQASKLVVEVQDFLSPAILERLAQQNQLLAPKIDDWRALVDCVMIDPAYDGQVFRVALADLPAKKADLVQGTYELPAPKGETRVAVKIIDMLGEEVLVVAAV